ncbi:DUF5610 domain-containing protein [Thiomicrorhabdus sp. 6S3-12]|nr:DUF5610 domain-containing protein [Thiomicrorhabdus sp. 6S3-12]
MAMDIKAFGALQAYQKSNDAAQDNRGRGIDKSLVLPEQASEQAKERVATNPAAVKFEQQANLVATLFGDKTQAPQSALKISFQSAIEEINKQLRIDLGLDEGAADPISAEALQQQGGMDYWSPENTAQRIVQGSTAFLSGFQNAHPELEGEELINRFMEVIGNGISTGFEQAKSFLGDLNVMNDEIAGTINQTYELVQSGLENFRNDYLGIETSVEADEESPENTSSSNS